MHKVERMTQHPITCLYCGRGNTPDGHETLDDFWAIDLERDVNWGDSTYLCKYCVEKMAMQSGFVTMADLTEQQNVVRAQARKIHDLQAKLEAKSRRLQQINDGRAAVRKNREEFDDTPVKPKKKPSPKKAAA